MAIEIRLKFSRLQGVLALRHVDDAAPEHELADRIGETAVRNGEAILDGEPRPLLVGREEDVDRRAKGDLGIEGTGGAGDQDRLVSGLLLEERGNLSRGLAEVGGDRHTRLSRLDGRGEDAQQEAEGGGNRLEFHGAPQLSRHRRSSAIIEYIGFQAKRFA